MAALAQSDDAALRAGATEALAKATGVRGEAPSENELRSWEIGRSACARG